MKPRSRKKTAAAGRLKGLDAAQVRRRRAPSSDWVHPLNVALARVIREWRRRRGLKATDVAAWARVARGTLAGIEAAKAWYSWNMVLRVCDAMGLDVASATFEALRRCRRLRRELRAVYWR